MNQRLISEIGRTQRLEIINSLKRTKGMSVNELVGKNEDELHGHQTALPHPSARRLSRYLAPPAKNGAPGDGLPAYPSEPRSFSGRQQPVHAGSVEIGPGNLRTERAGEAPLQHFRKEDRGAQSQGQRAKRWPSARNGWPRFATTKATWRSSSTRTKTAARSILECHSPILNLLDRYPIIGRFEQDMFEAVLGTRVRREEIRNSGLYECAFYFAV